ncbi:UNVERIFIED_CONTAM: hypothetical protein Sindi_3141800 [Sesamum indicum]
MAWAWLVLALFWRRESGKGTPAGRLSGGLRCCVRPMPICIVCAECLPVRNGKPSGASFDCDLLKHGQHKPRPSKGWSVGPLMLVGLPPHKRTDPVACEHGGVKGGRRRLAPPPVGSRWHPHGRVLEGGLGAGGGQGQGGPPAAPKPRPSSWLGRGLCWPCFGSESPARDSGGALERGSTVLRAADAHLHRVRRMPSRPQRQAVGGVLRLRFAKTWPTQAPSKQRLVRSVRLCLSASPRISGPMRVPSDSTPVACEHGGVKGGGDGLHPDRRLPVAPTQGGCGRRRRLLARDPEISSTWLAKCRHPGMQGSRTGAGVCFWVRLLVARRLRKWRRRTGKSVRSLGFCSSGSQLVLRPESSCLPGHAWACLLPFACRDARMRRGNAGVGLSARALRT